MNGTHSTPPADALARAALLEPRPPAPPRVLASVTLSREAGARGRSVARALARRLDASAEGADAPSWAVYDDDLVRKALSDGAFSESLAPFLGEDHSLEGEWDETVGEILGRYPPLDVVREHVKVAMRQLMHRGHAILVGRGSHCIAEGLSSVVRVRLVGSPVVRRRHLAAMLGVGEVQADLEMRRLDAARRRHVRRYFDSDIEDPLAYDLVVNTDGIPDEGVAAMIAAEVRRREG